MIKNTKAKIIPDGQNNLFIHNLLSLFNYHRLININFCLLVPPSVPANSGLVAGAMPQKFIQIPASIGGNLRQKCSGPVSLFHINTINSKPDFINRFDFAHWSQD